MAKKVAVCRGRFQSPCQQNTHSNQPTPASSMPGRRNRVPNVYNIHVPTEVAAHTQAAHALLAAVIKHLTFAREQCHAPYPQLELHAKACQQQQAQQLQQRGRRKRLSSSARKAVKYYERLSAMLELAAHIPHQQLQGMAVAVLLGSSVQRPREVFCMHFPAAMHATGTVPAPSAAAVSAATRKLLRALVMEHETVTEWDEPPGPTKMWLLFQAPDGVLQAAPEGFTIRRAFNINLRKAFQVNLLLGGQTPGQWEQQQKQPQQLRPQQQQPHLQFSQQQQQQQHIQQPAVAAAQAGQGGHVGMEVDDLSQQLTMHMSIRDAGGVEACPVWFQCSVHVKGLKPASSSN